MAAPRAPPTRHSVATQARALTGNRTRDPLVCKPAPNPLSHTSQGLMSLYAVFSLPTCLQVTVFRMGAEGQQDMEMAILTALLKGEQ